jgi:hypothetical protein
MVHSIWVVGGPYSTSKSTLSCTTSHAAVHEHHNSTYHKVVGSADGVSDCALQDVHAVCCTQSLSGAAASYIQTSSSGHEARGDGFRPRDAVRVH